ncbi:MAG: NB-ARC domain-containing protein [Ardenticatenaceae bacterium]
MNSKTNIQKLQADVHQALRLWHKDNFGQSPIDYLYVFQKGLLEGLSISQANNKVLLNALTLMPDNEVDYPTLLRRRFLDRDSVQFVAEEFTVAKSTLFRFQSDAINSLSEVINLMEKEALAEREIVLNQRVGPPSYVHLVGVDEHLARLTNLLVSPGSPWIIVLEGLGGIGKTTLAEALLRQINEQNSFYDFGWIRARRSILNTDGPFRIVNKPLLTKELLMEQLVDQLTNFSLASMSLHDGFRALVARVKRAPHLIVIDNLETAFDIQTLLPTLRRLIAPSKIVLTTREGLPAEADVSRFTVPQLSRTYADQLIRQEANLGNVAHLSKVSEEQLGRIYDTVGGNPLALRLVVGQTQIHNLDLVLKDLMRARGDEADHLYTHVYRRAWDNLDEEARITFLSMPLVIARGGSFDFLKAISGLGGFELTRALEHLVHLNLVEVRGGGLSARKYAIHQLTRTFLQEQVAKWH